MLPHTLDLAKGVLQGSRVCLSRAVTLVESSNPQHEIQAELLLDYVLNNRDKSVPPAFRLGITGPPGAGKSTFIEALGTQLTLTKKLAVVAIDPSSTRTHGSILGDKTRMTVLSANPKCFVRPSPSRGYLGGVCEHTNDVCLLCECAGFDTIIVETVGLGQSEVQVDEVVDMLVLLVPPANGDELQGIKKGVMEVADMVVVNKADGATAALANHAVVDYSHAFQLARRKRPDWRPRVKKCSSLPENPDDSVAMVWKVVEKFQNTMQADITRKRITQSNKWMWSEFHNQLRRVANEKMERNELVGDLERKLTESQVSPRLAGKLLLQKFLTQQ
ncbi:LAO/AO transport system ATPase [Batrachochytrium salamandrivorans]|nr:LAO/AO transport system ATPase [Batrachochytrium salamandrivorans]